MPPKPPPALTAAIIAASRADSLARRLSLAADELRAVGTLEARRNELMSFVDAVVLRVPDTGIRESVDKAIQEAVKQPSATKPIPHVDTTMSDATDLAVRSIEWAHPEFVGLVPHDLVARAVAVAKPRGRGKPPNGSAPRENYDKLVTDIASRLGAAVVTANAVRRRRTRKST